MKLIAQQDFSKYYKLAVRNKLLEDDDTLAIFFDLSILEDRVNILKHNFPSDSNHAIAIKTNPLSFILKYLVESGCGLEAASATEVLLACNAGLANQKIVFDSPAKTESEIKQLKQDCSNLHINADSLSELNLYSKHGSGFTLGLRINPAIKNDAISYMNVSGEESKFGEGLHRKEDIISAFMEWDDLVCLHIHSGSQYSDLDPCVEAISLVVDLAKEINDISLNKNGKKKITTIDIGGGFPVNYFLNEKPFNIESYVGKLKQACPELFSGEYKLITEFGRFVHANAAWAVSNIEYVKPAAEMSNIITHAGADMFLRECYNPGDWHHELQILNSDGELKEDSHKAKMNIGGPLCFGGDFIDRNRQLPKVSPGDKLVIQDVGANSFSLWSRHCSRPFPKVIAYRSELNGEDMRVTKQRESVNKIIEFWS